MKKFAVVFLILLVAVPTIAAFAKTDSDASSAEPTVLYDDISFSDADCGMTGDTLGGSAGGAVMQDADDLFVYGAADAVAPDGSITAAQDVYSGAWDFPNTD